MSGHGEEQVFSLCQTPQPETLTKPLPECFLALQPGIVKPAFMPLAGSVFVCLMFGATFVYAPTRRFAILSGLTTGHAMLINARVSCLAKQVMAIFLLFKFPFIELAFAHLHNNYVANHLMSPYSLNI
jgi:hypothetical protein